ncbi:plasmodesmata-located protein 8 isoform X2 [Elaeis guineensis]|uniref:Plasmodesmata-located protein 8 n=2 Tax=Elaeis guineensis var. tenera TaxID=51953 RepID=A0A6J0PPF7_ELAGV|nr:plasmodesmata-located protein 8 [Elaeis guineensis]
MSLKKLCSPFNSFLLCFLAFLYPIHQAKAASFIYAGCSPSKFQPSSPYQNNLISLLTSVAAAGSQATYNSFAVGNDSASATGAAVYGLYQCRNDLSAGECSSCVQSAVGQLNLVCPDSYAASLQLDGCFVRYSNENFLGRPDTSLVYRKCSASASKDAEFFRRRDDVLADLQNGVGFRVSSSGTVQGYAQCVGDLSSADCTACLAQAVGQLKNSCGSAMAADVYLGQCYAKYWASGYYFRSTTGYTEDDIGRTIAIIVGIFAGVVLFVVFLSFLKKAC